MTDKLINEIAQKIYYANLSWLSPAIQNDSRRERYWNALSEEYRDNWRSLVVLVVHEYELDKETKESGKV